MALLFKTIKWYEWVLITVLVMGSVGAYLIWNKYDELRDVVANVNANNAQLIEKSDYKDQSAAITDKVVTEFVQEQSDVQVQQEQSRYGVIDEYINMSGGSAIKYPEPIAVVSKPVEKSVSRPEKKVEAPPTRSRDSDAAVAARLGTLAGGMRKHYCAAAPERGDGCNTLSPNG